LESNHNLHHPTTNHSATGPIVKQVIISHHYILLDMMVAERRWSVWCSSSDILYCFFLCIFNTLSFI